MHYRDYKDGIRNSLDKIFAAVLIGGMAPSHPRFIDKCNIYKVCMPRFNATFQSDIFIQEYALFYEVIVALKIKNFDEAQLTTILDNNSDLVMNSPYIDLDQWKTAVDNRVLTDDEVMAVVSDTIIECYRRLSNTVVSEDEFTSASEIYISFFRNNLMFTTTQHMTQIMSDIGFEDKIPGKRSRMLKGYEAATMYYNEKMKMARELDSVYSIRSTVIDQDWYIKDAQQEEDEDHSAIMDTGLTEIDSVIGGFHRGHMIGILGPAKGGKTKFANYLTSRALEMGLNVAVWPLEGSKEEWTSMQIASIIMKQSGTPLSSKDIEERKYANEAVKQMVKSAKLKLSSEPKMGRLSFISGTAYIENFIDVLKSHYDTENPFDIIVIDSLVNIMSKTGRGKVERISDGYMMLKDFIANKMSVPALALLPAQIKQAIVDYLRSHPDETIDITAGAESAETIRSPDEVIGLFSTKDERALNMMKLYHVASRHSATFPDFKCESYLGCAFFASVNET